MPIKSFIPLWTLSALLLFLFPNTLQAQTTPDLYFANYGQSLTDYTTFGSVTLGEQIDLSLTAEQTFSAVSPNFTPPALHDDFAYELQFSLTDFTLEDQFEFRYFFFPDGSFNSLRCTVTKVNALTCALFETTGNGTTQFAKLPSTVNGAANPSVNTRYTLKLFQNANVFKINLWPTDQANTGQYMYYHYHLSQDNTHLNVFPPALVLTQTENASLAAKIGLHQFLYSHSHYLTNLNLWPSAQTDPLWQDQILGHTGTTDQPQTIGEIGCALTSAAMIFNYYHYHTLPDGTTLDPDGLNQWLIKQKDGYVNKNLLNWQALTRLSTQLHQQYHLSDSQFFPKFEYKYVKDDTTAINWEVNYLNTGIHYYQEPLILEIPGHFLVSDGITPDETFQIKDPYYTTRHFQSDYPSGLIPISFRRLVPSFTDQSYLIINVLGQSKVRFTNGLGHYVKYSTTPLYSPNSTGGQSVIVGYQYLIAQPADDTYRISLSSPATDSRFSIFAYNIAGEVATFLNEEVAIHPDGETIKVTLHKNESIDFAIFDDLNRRHQTWIDFAAGLTWPWQFLHWQFNFLVEHEQFTLADFYRQNYLSRNLISQDLSDQLHQFWQNQL